MSEKLKIRFPNDDCYYDFDLNKLKDFKIDKEFERCFFGTLNGTYIDVLKPLKKGIYINPFE